MPDPTNEPARDPRKHLITLHRGQGPDINDLRLVIDNLHSRKLLPHWYSARLVIVELHRVVGGLGLR